MDMKDLFLAIFAALISLVGPFPFDSPLLADGNMPRKVIILNSYHPNMTFSDEEVRGIRSILAESTEVFVEYMDTKRIATPDYLDLLEHTYLLKYSAMKFDMVFSLDDDALRFLLQRHSRIFPETPVVFCGVNNLVHDMLDSKPLFTGVVEAIDISATIDLALKIKPLTQRVLVITDSTTSGRSNRDTLMRIARSRRHKVEFVFLDNGGGLLLPELLASLRSAPGDSIVYYSDFFQDRSGNTLNLESVMPQVSAAAPGPVFVHGAIYLGYGAVGGKLNSGFYQGQTAGRLALRIWAGEKPSDIPVVRGDVNRYMFDFRQLKRWGIPLSELPRGSDILFQEVSFYQKYLHWIWGIAIFVLLESAIIILLAVNILRRREAQLSLRKSEERYRTIFENATEAIFQSTPDGRYLSVNPSLARMFGYSSPHELMENVKNIGHDLYVNPLDRDKLLSMLREKGSIEGYNVELYRRDRSRFWISLNIHEVKDPEGKLQYLEGTHTDITDRKRTQDELLKINEELDRFFTVTLDLLCIADTDGKFRRLNLAWEKTLGYTRDELMDGRFYDFIHPDDIESTTQAVSRLNAQEEVIDFINRYRCKDGTYRWIEWRSFPQGKLIYAAARDITDRILAQEELLESERRFRLAFETSPDAVNINRMEDGLYVDVNEGFTSLTGFTREEVIGKTSVEINLWNNPDDRKKLIQGLRAKGYYDNLEAQFRKKDASIGIGLMSARVMTLKGVPHILSITRDITERKRVEKEKEKLEAQLVQAQKMESIGTLAGGIAHDFNNILAAIIGYSELALDDVSDPVKLKAEISEVIKAGGRAKNLVAQILTFSRKTEQAYTPLELPTLVKESLKMLRSVIPTTIDIRSELIESGLVMSNPTQIHQLMMNLCTNAAHAMEETGGVLSVTLGKTIFSGEDARDLVISPGAYIKLTVSDTGHGMTPEIMEKIFEPYFTTKELGRGTGLGLSVVHGIVKSHGGSIVCRSKPEKGTTFEVYLPELELGKEPVESVKEDYLFKGSERILFIDDEPDLASIAKKMLGKLGYDVTTSTSSLEALDLFKADPDRFDLVVTDMTMPGMTGDKLARKLMEIRPGIPVILCTGYSDRVSGETTKEIGIREYIMKPLQKKTFAGAIRKVLDQR